MLRVASIVLALSLPAQLLAFSAPGAARVRPLAATQQPARCVAKAEIEQLAELAKKVPVADLPEPIQPWAKEYLGQPTLFAGDLLALLLAAGLNPIAALPYILVWVAAAKPLNAYAADATASYGKVLSVVAPAYGASTLGGILLSAPFDFSVPGALGKLVVSIICLAGPRAFQVYQTTGALPDMNFDLDAALGGNVQNFEDKFGSQARTDDDKRPPTGGL